MTKFQSVESIADKDLDEAIRRNVLYLTNRQNQILKKELRDKKITRERFFRRLLEFIKPNSEFDIILIIKQVRTIVQIEVKSSTINEEEKTTHNTVNMRYSSAKDQLLKGKEMFNKITQLYCNNSDSWRHVGLVCFPYIKSRDDLDKIIDSSPDDLKVK